MTADYRTLQSRARLAQIGVHPDLREDVDFEPELFRGDHAHTWDAQMRVERREMLRDLKKEMETAKLPFGVRLAFGRLLRAVLNEAVAAEKRCADLAERLDRIEGARRP